MDGTINAARLAALAGSARGAPRRGAGPLRLRGALPGLVLLRRLRLRDDDAVDAAEARVERRRRRAERLADADRPQGPVPEHRDRGRVADRRLGLEPLQRLSDP